MKNSKVWIYFHYKIQQESARGNTWWRGVEGGSNGSTSDTTCMCCTREYTHEPVRNWTQNHAQVKLKHEATRECVLCVRNVKQCRGTSAQLECRWIEAYGAQYVSSGSRSEDGSVRGILHADTVLGRLHSGELGLLQDQCGLV